jgi:hypothetical protein
MRVNMGNENRLLGKSHAPKGSVMFEKVMPVLLIALGILTLVLIGFATALLLGFVHI